MSDPDDTEREEGIDPASIKPKSSKAWLAMLASARKAGFSDYSDRCDNIDKRYASLERLASATRDREFQIFWANIQVLGPSIYSRPPVPVVVPRFKDKRPLYRMAAELLERSTIVLFEMEDIDGVMRAIRDDLVISARGVVWLRYDAKAKDTSLDEKVCIEHVERKDFLHDPARSWKEVDWVAKRSWLTKSEMRKRFRKASGDVYKDAAYAVRKDADANDDGRLKAAVWELWSKSADRVVWITENVEQVLDEDKPHLKLEGFFPCPKPAYGTTQRSTLIPVPDYVYYKDQIEEINELTARISALTEGLKLRGFYPAGAGEIGDAVEAAVANQSNRQILVPISNWAAIGNGAAKDMIIWLPIDLVAKTVTACIENRRQLIDDVYQITGLSDIMRGATVASETLGAQQLKSQYGSIRIRDRQDELTRIARDITRIAAEIMAENFDGDTLIEMSQMEIKSDKDVKGEVRKIEQQAQDMARELAQAQQDPEIQSMMSQDPQKAQAAMAQVQQQMQQLQGQMQQTAGQITIEQIMKGLRDQRIRPFTLDIETDSTIAPDENAAKQRATEALTAIGAFMGQAFPLLQADPSAAPVVSDLLKYVAGQYRMGREVDTSIEEFAEQMKAKAGQPQPNPAAAEAEVKAQAEAAKQKAEAERDQATIAMEKQRLDGEMALKSAELEARQQEAGLKAQAAQIDAGTKQAEAKARLAEIGAKTEATRAQHDMDMQKSALELQKMQAEIDRIGMQTAAAVQAAEIKANEPKTGVPDGD